MIYRIIFYIIGITLTALGFTLIIIYLSFNNIGYSLLENITLIFKTPSIYLFTTGLIISLASLFYDLLNKK